MRIYDVPIESLTKIATDLRMEFRGNDVSSGRGFRVQGSLKPRTGYVNRYQRTSASWQREGRKVAAICWHGYRDWMREVFKQYPNARITSGLYGKQDYRGKDNFEDTHKDSGWTPIGPRIYDGYPLLCQACICPESGEVE